MKLELLTLEHCRVLRVPPHLSAHAANLLDPQFMGELIEGGPAWALVDGELVLGIGGVVDRGGGRGEVWSVFGELAYAKPVAAVRAAREGLARTTFRRLELVTRCDYAAAHRFAQVLRFKFEASLRAWFPDGSAGYMWSRIK